jgi:hypothetical protein
MKVKDSVKNSATFGLLVGITFSAIIGVITLAQYCGEKGIDVISPSKNEYVVLKLKHKKQLMMPATHAIIDAGEFETLEGKVLIATDYCRISEGKMFSNEYIYKMKEDSTYIVKLVGNETLGYTITGASKNN